VTTLKSSLDVSLVSSRVAVSAEVEVIDHILFKKKIKSG
jgi:hypothetical protein